MAGRNSKLTPALHRKIVKLLREGNYFQTACKASGITYQTGYNWLKKGKASKEGACREFYLAVEKAQAEAELERVKRIREAGKGGALIKRVTFTKKDGTEVVEEHFTQPQWSADMTHLERQYPDRWGRRDKQEITGEGGKPVIIKVIYDNGKP